MVKITQLVRDNADLKFIAYVKKRALSAGAIIAMSCPRIYVAPDATIGAAVPFKMGADGTPRAIEAKFASAICAEMRNTARLAGHDELWVRGMTELDVALAVDHGEAASPTTAPSTMPTTAPTDGPPVLRLASDAPKGAHVVKSAGKILTLTAADAVDFGLCAGTASDVAQLKDNLALRAWHVSDDGNAWRLVEDRARSARAAVDRHVERVNYVNRALPTLVYVDRRLRELTARAREVRDAVDDIKKDYESDMKDLESQRQLAVRRASIGSSPSAAIAQINEDFVAKREAIKQRYVPQLKEYVQESKAALAEIEQLNDRRKQLLASAPSGDE
jgi:hypothetical protein